MAESHGHTTEVDTSGNKEDVESNAGESSPEKKQPRQRKKTKAELKAELKEQKVMERKSRRRRVRNQRYVCQGKQSGNLLLVWKNADT